MPAVTKRLVGHVENSSYPPINVDIQLSLTTPAAATAPVPVIMEFGFGGRGFGPPPGGRTGPTWQEQVVAKGWGRIQGYDSNTGTFSVNGGPRRQLPSDKEVFTLTS